MWYGNVIIHMVMLQWYVSYLKAVVYLHIFKQVFLRIWQLNSSRRGEGYLTKKTEMDFFPLKKEIENWKSLLCGILVCRLTSF